MYALIYDKHDLIKKGKKVISIHRKRETAETALEKRKIKLGRKVWECNTRIVWINGSIKSGQYVTPGQYSSWRPGEKVPYGEMYSDSD
jgi:hypothetical protein